MSAVEGGIGEVVYRSSVAQRRSPGSQAFDNPEQGLIILVIG